MSKLNPIKDSKTKKEYTGKTKSNDIVTMMEQEWSEMTAEFKKLQREQYELFCHKQHDYGPGNISVGTQLKTPEEINLSLTGLWFRMNDKLQRVKTLIMTGRDSAVKDEPLEDAYLDVSNYGIMATSCWSWKVGSNDRQRRILDIHFISCLYSIYRFSRLDSR